MKVQTIKENSCTQDEGHTEELHNLVLFGKYYQWNQIKENRMTGNVLCFGEVNA
jgi:hypothetical protein